MDVCSVKESQGSILIQCTFVLKNGSFWNQVPENENENENDGGLFMMLNGAAIKLQHQYEGKIQFDV